MLEIKILKEDRRPIREVNNVDELNVFTEKYYNSLKTNKKEIITIFICLVLYLSKILI